MVFAGLLASHVEQLSFGCSEPTRNASGRPYWLAVINLHPDCRASQAITSETLGPWLSGTIGTVPTLGVAQPVSSATVM
jgi:hypothetical protein